MKTFLIGIIISCFLAIPLITKDTKKIKAIELGYTESLYSTVLKEERKLEIGLPYGFKSGKGSYPLVLVLDGGDLFRYVKSYLDVLTPNFFPEMVVVGVPNTNRGRDLDVRNGKMTGAKNFQKFIAKELLPYLKQKYQTTDFNILMGHSLGGLFALHTLLEGSLPFQAAIATSPSLNQKEGKLTIELDLKNINPEKLKGKYLFYSAGGDEDENLIKYLKDLSSRLKKIDSKGFTLGSEVFDGEGHFPIKGFYQGIRSLFANWGPPTHWFFKGNLQELISHYKAKELKFQMKVTPPSDLIWSLRSRLKREKKQTKLIEATFYHVQQYPHNTVRYLVLADLYLEIKQKDKAIKMLEEGLRINPRSKNIQAKIREIKAQ